jgi:uncharacterized repeat protein (TIGR03847 family)
VSESQVSPEVFTADYLGEPGSRTFYIQSRAPEQTLSFLVEKQQVALLAEKLREVLLLIDETDTIRAALAARDPALALLEPAEPRWRIATIGIGYEENGDYLVIVVSPADRSDVDDEESETAGPGEVGGTPGDEDEESFRFHLRRDQARSFVLHASAIVEEGRPLCQLCGLPMDPSGHLCPASNGHRLTIV